MIFFLIILIILVNCQSVNKVNATLVFNSNFIGKQMSIPPENITMFPENFYENVTMTHIGFSNNKEMFVAFPRIKKNVPFTLGKFNFENKLFYPFPDFNTNNCDEELNKEEKNFVSKNFPKKAKEEKEKETEKEEKLCLENIHSFEIDGEDRMWIIDNGNLFLDEPRNRTIKIIVFDLKSQKVLLKYKMEGNNVINSSDPLSYKDALDKSIINEIDPLFSYFTDMVVDSKSSILYAVDAGLPFVPRIKPKEGSVFNSSILVFDFETQKSKRALHNAQYGAVNFDTYPAKFQNKEKNCSMTWGIHNIGSNCELEKIFFTSFKMRGMHSLPTNTLLMYNDYSFINSSVMKEDISVNDENEGFASDFIFSSFDNMFVMFLKNNSISVLKNSQKTLQLVYRNDSLTNFLFGFGFSDNELYFFSNSFCDFLSNDMNFSDPFNFAILKFSVEGKSYSAGCEFSGYGFGTSEIITLSTVVSFMAAFLISGIGFEWTIRLTKPILFKKFPKLEKFFSKNKKKKSHNNL